MPQLQNNLKNILCIYSATQTYTSTVFEHLDSFRKYSKFAWAYLDIAEFNNESLDVEFYDAIVIHYSIRLPFGQVSDLGIQKLIRFQGLKILFIQDEYDNTNVVKKIIDSIPFELVFTVVPTHSIEKIYPSNEFHQTRFISNLTGYVPDGLISQLKDLTPLSRRSIIIAYRGRPLPIRYGRLGQEKIAIGQHVRNYCRKHGVVCDIEWDEGSRIYGDNWYKFIGSSKAMLGSESGSNVFDWNGDLQQIIELYSKAWPNATEEDIYRGVIEKCDIDGLMNQVSPRVFEMAAAKTAMILFEGGYSGVLEAGIHYLPLKKDFSNLDHVIAELKDDAKMNAMVERAYQDIIISERYSYRNFVAMVDAEIETTQEAMKRPLLSEGGSKLSKATRFPVRSKPPLPVLRSPLTKALGRLALKIWQYIPIEIRPYIKRMVRRS